MDNYNRALELEEVSLNSAGSAMEKYGVYVGSIEAKLAEMKASVTELYDETLNSDLVKFIIDVLNGVVNMATEMGGLLNVIMLIGGAWAVIKGFKVVANIKSAVVAIKAGTKATYAFGTALQTTLGGIGLIIMALGAVTSIIKGVQHAQEESARIAHEIRQQTIKDVEEEIDAYEKLKDEYVSLSYTENQTESQKKRLEEVTNLLNTAMGLELGLVNDLTGAYGIGADAYAAFIDEKIKKNNDLKDELETSRSLAQSTLDSEKRLDFISGGGEAHRKAIGRLYTVDEQKAMNEQYGGVFDVDSAMFSTVQEHSLEDRIAILSDIQSRLAKKLETEGDLSTKESKGLSGVSEELEILKAEMNDAQSTVDKYNEILGETKMYEANKVELGKLAQSMDEFNNSTLEEQVEQYQAIEAQIAALIAANPEYEEMINDMTEAFENEAEAIKNTDFALLALEKNMKALKELQKLEEAELKNKEKLLAVEKAREELARAKDQRMRVFRAGQGFVYEEDSRAVQDAKKNLDDALTDDEGSVLDKLIAQTEELQKIYNQAILDGKEVDGDTLRETFLDAEELKKFKDMSMAAQKAFLEKFLESGSWEQTLADQRQDILDSLAQDLPSGVLPTSTASRTQAFSGSIGQQTYNGHLGMTSMPQLTSGATNNSSTQNININKVEVTANDSDAFMREIDKMAENHKPTGKF